MSSDGQRSESREEIGSAPRAAASDIDWTSGGCGGVVGANAATPPTPSFSLAAGGVTSRNGDDGDGGDDDDDGSGSGSGSSSNTDTSNKAESRAGSGNGSSNDEINDSAALRAGREVENGSSKLPVVPARHPAAVRIGAAAAAAAVVCPEVTAVVTRSGGKRRSSSAPVVIPAANTSVLLPPPSESGKGKGGEEESAALPPKPRMSQVTVAKIEA